MYSVIAFDAMRTDEEHLLATPVKMGSFTSPYIQWHVKKKFVHHLISEKLDKRLWSSLGDAVIHGHE